MLDAWQDYLGRDKSTEVTKVALREACRHASAAENRLDLLGEQAVMVAPTARAGTSPRDATVRRNARQVRVFASTLSRHYFQSVVDTIEAENSASDSTARFTDIEAAGAVENTNPRLTAGNVAFNWELPSHARNA
jgi:hypothetical protein